MPAAPARIVAKLAVVLLAVALIAAFWSFDLGRYLSLPALKSQQAAFAAFYRDNQLATLSGYFLVYVLTTALSLPGATILTLAGGALFGLGTGLVVVSFASTLGATAAFLAARYVLRDSIQHKFSERLRTINSGIEREGAFYLFTLRMIPAVPFFVINVVMALTPIPTRTYYWVSQLGMLPGTAVYVNAGTQLASITSLDDILSARLIASFTALGLLPLATKWGVALLRRQR